MCQHPHKQAFYDLVTSQDKGLESSDPENPFYFLLSVFAIRVSIWLNRQLNGSIWQGEGRTRGFLSFFKRQAAAPTFWPQQEDTVEYSSVLSSYASSSRGCGWCFSFALTSYVWSGVRCKPLRIAGSSAERYTGIKPLESFPVVCISVVTFNLCICEHKQLHSSLPSPPLPVFPILFLVGQEKQFSNEKIVLDAIKVQYCQHNCY